MSQVDEYAKNSELKTVDVQYLLDWAAKQPHLPKLTEREVILFLHACMYSLEYTKTALDNYYTFRTHCPEYFSKRYEIINNKYYENVLFYFLPKTQNDVSVLFFKIIDPACSKFNFDNILTVFSMVYDIYLLKNTTAKGHALLIDVSNLELCHLTKVNIMSCKKFTWYLQEALPIRKSGMYIVNVVPIVDKLLNMLRPFTKKEMFDLIKLFQTPKDLQNHFSKDLLPKCLGGNGPTIEEMQEFMKKDLIAHQDYFKEEEQTKRVDEKLRVGKAKDPCNIFGIEGSFKKLDID